MREIASGITQIASATATATSAGRTPSFAGRRVPNEGCPPQPRGGLPSRRDHQRRRTDAVCSTSRASAAAALASAATRSARSSARAANAASSARSAGASISGSKARTVRSTRASTSTSSGGPAGVLRTEVRGGLRRRRFRSRCTASCGTRSGLKLRAGKLPALTSCRTRRSDTPSTFAAAAAE